MPKQKDVADAEFESDEYDADALDGEPELDEDEDSGERGPSTWERLKGRPKRPGEQDPLQSPLVMWLFAGAVVLAITASVLWFFIQASRRRDAYEAAKAELDGRRYRQAVKLYEGFLQEYGGSNLAGDARLELARAKVLKEVDTATPDWETGLTAVRGLIDEFRDLEAFDELKPDVHQYALTIALGSAKDATRGERREPLQFFESARPLAVQYATPEAADELRAKLDEALEKAEAAIHRRETYDAAVAAIDGHLETGDPLAAFDARRDLLDQFADYAGDAGLAERFTAALTAERARVRVEVVDRAAETEAEAVPTGATIVRNQRNRSDRTASGERVLGWAGGSVFGLDAATGAPAWKRVLGVDPPFFPIETAGTTPGVLAFDDQGESVQHVDASSGALLWRQPLSGRPVGAPLVDQGRMLVGLEDGRVCRLDAESGQMVAVAHCPQPLSTAPVSLGDGRIAVAGERSVLYVFETTPLALADVVYLGQRRGSVVDLRFVRPYLLVVENDREQSARLQLLDAALDGDPPTPAGGSRVAGLVRDPVLVRGRRLFVPFGLERVATFTMSAEPGQPAIVATARLTEGGEDVPISILAGPADEFWTGGTAVRRYRVLLDTVRQEGDPAAAGRHVQPLRGAGDLLYVGYRNGGPGTVVSELQRRTFEAGWKTTLGDPIVGVTSEPSGAVLAATRSGAIHRLALDQPVGSAFVDTPLYTIPMGDAAGAEAFGTPTERGFVFVGRDRGKAVRWKLWGFEAGQPPRVFTRSLEAQPTLSPVVVDKAYFVATGGRIWRIPESGAPLYYDAANPDSTWRTMAAVTGGVVAQDDAGNVVRLVYQPAPVAHLARVAATTIDSAFGLAGSGDAVAVVAPDNSVVVRTASRFERLGEFPFEVAPARAPWLVGRVAVVETRDGLLHGCAFGPGAAPRWSIDLEGSSPAGRPLIDNGLLLVVGRDGRLWWIEPSTGRVAKRDRIQAVPAGAPRRIGAQVVVATEDGGVVALPEGRAIAAEDQP